jgi:hypothetical protein
MFKKYGSLIASAILVFSCAQKSENNAADTIEASMERAQTTPAALASAPVPDVYSNGKKIIKKAHYRFEVKNVKAATKVIESSILKFGAYIESSNLVLENPFLESKITIRVPNESFGDLLQETDAQAVFVNFRNVTTDDISKDFVDLESRLKTKREVEQRYTAILRHKAGTIDELLQAEEKIGDLHEEIEATISRLNYLKDQVTYSTIQLEIYQTIAQQVAAVESESFQDKAGEAVAAGWTAITNICIALLYLWPALLLIPIAYYFIRKRKITARMKSA